MEDDEWTCEGERPEGNDARSLNEEGSLLLESLASFSMAASSLRWYCVRDLNGS